MRWSRSTRAKQMHESKKALKFGLKIIAHMKLLADKMKRQEGMRLVLEQTPAESTSYRFARLDMQYFSPASGRVVKGDVASGEVYYTNSTHLNVRVPMNPIERVTNEGLFHPLIEAGSISHVWIGESQPSKGAIADFVIKTFRHTTSDQIAFSPEFTTCNTCNRTSRGLQDDCALLRLAGCRRHHPDHGLLHQGLELEQGQAGRAEGPLQKRGILRRDRGEKSGSGMIKAGYRVQGSGSSEGSKVKTSFVLTGT